MTDYTALAALLTILSVVGAAALAVAWAAGRVAGWVQRRKG